MPEKKKHLRLRLPLVSLLIVNHVPPSHPTLFPLSVSATVTNFRGNNNENIPVWSVKPSSLLQLMIANPNTSRSVIRHPDTSDSSAIGNPTQAVKWKEEIEFADNSVTLPINLFLDDTATHKSRQWKALHCIQMQLAGLPLHERNKLGSVKFLGATEKADIMDLAQLIVDDIRQLQLTGVESFDAFMNRECVVRSSLDIIIADCAMLSYCCNHLGAAATKFCPRCHADADHFMAVGQKRTPQETKRTIQRIEMRSTETDKKQLRKRKGIKEHKNVLWDFLDPHRDIPVGMLHLIPLGIAKDLVVIIKDQQDEAVVKKMQHHLTDLRPGSDMKDFFKFIRSKQGKHFKNYLQVAPFNMKYAGVQRHYIQLITCLAKIQRSLLQTSFSEESIDDLREDIRTFHQLIHWILPEFKKKLKVHLLLHIVEDIERHGPPRYFEEDQFESNHGRVRDMIFKQNQKARSRDTSMKFAKGFLCLHVISGGYVKDNETWKQSSSSVIKLGECSSVKKYLGIQDTAQRSSGKVSLMQRSATGNVITESCDEDVILQALVVLNRCDQDLRQYQLRRGKAVACHQNGLVHAGEWVKYSDTSNNVSYGVLREGLVIIPKRGSAFTMAMVQRSTQLSSSSLGCHQFQLEAGKDLIPSGNVIVKVEMIHKCGIGCRIVEKDRRERLEQEDVIRRLTYLKHDSGNKTYVFNMYKV